MQEDRLEEQAPETAPGKAGAELSYWVIGAPKAIAPGWVNRAWDS
jgi:hypothetical protein